MAETLDFTKNRDGERQSELVFLPIRLLASILEDAVEWQKQEEEPYSQSFPYMGYQLEISASSGGYSALINKLNLFDGDVKCVASASFMDWNDMESWMYETLGKHIIGDSVYGDA